MTTETKNSNKETKPAATLEVKPEPFESTIETQLISSDELCKKVCKIFKAVSPDEFIGCSLRPVNEPYGTRFDLLAYFTPNTRTEGFKVVKDVITGVPEEGKTMKVLNKIAIVQEDRRYELTDGAKAIFEEFMYTDQKGKVNWKNEVVEIKEERMPYGVGSVRQTLARVQVRFDMYKLLGLMHGKKNEAGSPCEYAIMIRNELGRVQMNSMGNNLINQNAAIPRNWILSIERLDTNVVRAKAKAWNFMQPASDYSNIPMITAD